jgi:hypothetical protein
LPDGIFLNQKIKFGENFEGLAMEAVGIFYAHLVHFTAICHILWPFGIFSGYFFPVWCVAARKIWQPCCNYFERFQLKNLPFSSQYFLNTRCQLFIYI